MESVTCLPSKHEVFHSDFHTSCKAPGMVAYACNLVVRMEVHIHYIYMMKLIDTVRQKMMEEDNQAQPRAHTNVYICVYALCTHSKILNSPNIYECTQNNSINSEDNAKAFVFLLICQ